MRRSVRLLARLALCALFVSFFPQVSPAAPDLMVYPTRVLMGDRVRSAQVDIINTSQTQASYRISLVRKRMADTGEFQDVTEPAPDEKFADDMVKFSPRQVTLLPGAGQTIRIMFKPPTDMTEGEYRSHLVFSRLPSGISRPPETKDLEQNTLSMKVTANIGVSIPIILRHGELQARVAIDPATVKLATLDPKQQQIGFTISRAGTRSVYGDIAVYRGREKVAAGEGLSVYTPNSQRKVKLHILDQYQLKPGDTVQVLFTEKGDPKPTAEATVVLQ